MVVENIFNLKDKVIIITGASGLLGRQHADAVAAYGGIPILLDLDKKVVDDMAAEINNKYKINTIGYNIDITNENNIKNNCIDIIKRFGSIYALVNNAANNPKFEDTKKNYPTRLENYSINNWESDLAVGLTGAFLCAKHYGHAIAQNKEGGVIINISSDLGLISPDQRIYEKKNLPKEKQFVKPVTYSVIKTGLIGLTRYLSTYWGDSVRCNALCPGGVDNGLPSEFIEKISYRIPLGRMANPNEYQGVLIFLLSNASKYMTGAIIPMDGGRSVW